MAGHGGAVRLPKRVTLSLQVFVKIRQSEVEAAVHLNRSHQMHLGTIEALIYIPQK